MSSKGPSKAPAKGKKREAEPGGDRQDSSIDDVLTKLEGAVDALESGDLPLEQALARFEEGVKLAQVGNGMLDKLEQRVEQLLADRDETVPFATQGDADDDDL